MSDFCPSLTIQIFPPCSTTNSRPEPSPAPVRKSGRSKPLATGDELHAGRVGWGAARSVLRLNATAPQRALTSKTIPDKLFHGFL